MMLNVGEMMVPKSLKLLNERLGMCIVDIYHNDWVAMIKLII